MSITTTIVYAAVQPVTVSGSPVPLEQDTNGFIFHNTHLVKSVSTTISGNDTSVVLRVVPDANNADHVFIEAVTAVPIIVLPQADTGGVKWTIHNSRGQDLEFTASRYTSCGHKYEFDTSAQPPVQLKVVVLRG